MELFLRCDCGEKLLIHQKDAAGNKVCSCGNSFPIPRLTVLRRLEAEGKFDLSRAADEIVSAAPTAHALQPQAEYVANLTVAQELQLLAVEGQLPYETRCLQCEAITDHVLVCFIECESPATRPFFADWPSSVLTALFIILSPVRALIHFSRQQSAGPDHATDEVVVRAPLRICPECATRLRSNKRRVRELLDQLKLYQPLFAQYKKAKINIPKS